MEYYCNTHNFSILCIKKNLVMECYGKLILTKINANENEIFGKEIFAEKFYRQTLSDYHKKSKS